MNKDIKQKIINAAFGEFGENGYEHASTNNIVKRAGVAKGMLFYYFKSKQQLYEYLVEFGIESMKDVYVDRVTNITDDFIDRLKEVSKLKLEIYRDNPNMFIFFANSYVNDKDVSRLSHVIKKEIEFSINMRNLLYSEIDTSKFRNDIAKNEVMTMIKWTIKGYEQEILDAFAGKKVSDVNLDPYWKEFDKFIDNMKKVFHRQKIEA